MERLAFLLGVSSRRVSRWVEGDAPITPDTYLRCVDLLLDRTSKQSRMASHQIQCEVLQRGAEIAGGEDELAKRLNVRPEDVHEWVQGKATAPAGIYIMALDITSRDR